MKNIVPWKKELETGIELIDEQHKKFLKSTNRFIIKVRAEKQLDAAKEQIEFLQDYLLYHFQVEETFLYESHFPQYEEHQAAHKQITFKVKEMAILLQEKNYSEEVINEFCEFINFWIVDHILKNDIQFSKYIMNLKND